MPERYAHAARPTKGQLVDEVPLDVKGYHRKAVNGRCVGRSDRGDDAAGAHRSAMDRWSWERGEIWEAAGYPWSLRLQALLPTKCHHVGGGGSTLSTSSGR